MNKNNVLILFLNAKTVLQYHYSRVITIRDVRAQWISDRNFHYWKQCNNPIIILVMDFDS